MRGKIIAFATVAAILALLLVLQTTNPSSIGPVGLLAVFFLLYVVVMGCFTELIFAGSSMLRWIGKRIPGRRPPTKLSVTRSWYFASLYALAPIMFLAMQSIGSLGIYEVSLVLLFMIIGTVYISKRAPQ